MSCMELRNVSYTYPGEKMPVINNLTLQVERGTCLAVRGDNGSGKTTLLKNMMQMVWIVLLNVL